MLAMLSYFFQLVASTQSDWTPAIIGGRNAEYNSWIVPIFYHWGSLFCSGSIIHEKWVLTAAHCVDSPGMGPSDIYVLGGAYDLTDIAGAQKRMVKAVHLHEDWDPDGYREETGAANDIALLELQSEFCLNDNVTIVDMATEGYSYGVIQDYIYTGWGFTSNNSLSPPAILQELEGISEVTPEILEWFQGVYDICKDFLICSVLTGIGICFGDSGGPLWRRVDSNPVLYGIIHGFVGEEEENCLTQWGQASTRVSFYQEWIESITHISEDVGHYIVQGAEYTTCRDPKDSSCTAKVADNNELWNVRCCADSDPGDWYQNVGCSVYTNSMVPECYTTDWNTAVQICNDIGGRLCSKEELESPNFCSAKGGCGFNNFLVWSSTVGIVPTGPKNYIVKGATNNLCDEDTCSTREAGVEEQWGVRCCSDEYIGGWIQNEGCSVFARSTIETCAVTNWELANHLCDSAGGRLCTKQELESNCVKGTGCSLNSRMVWSSDSGFEKYYIVKGATGSACIDNSCITRAVGREEYWSVRCCANTNPGGWIQRDHCSVFAWSEVSGCTAADWDTAVELCEEVGGRLCTREELEMNCAAGSGCSANSKMVWSSTSDVDFIPKYYIVQGASSASCTETSCTTRLADGEELWSVRCCAEVNPGDWVQNEGCSVYAQSLIQTCAVEDLNTASDFCTAIGGRLCSKEELESDCAKNSGCSMNTKMVWSNTPQVECTS